MAYQRVDGNSDLVRDPKSGAILNINRSEFEKAKQARIKRFTKEREFDELKNEVSEIKVMLKQLLEKS